MLAQVQLLTRVYVPPCDTFGLHWEYKMAPLPSFLPSFPSPFVSFPTLDPLFFGIASHLISHDVLQDEDFSPSRNRLCDGGVCEPERCAAETVGLDRGTDGANEQRARQWTSRDQRLAGLGIPGDPVRAGAGGGFEVRRAAEVCWVECS
jgi:hypothetical protein